MGRRVGLGIFATVVILAAWLHPLGGGEPGRSISAAAAADTPHTGWTTTTHTMDVNGVARSYLVIRPAATSATLPVLVVMHGLDATPAAEAERTGFKDVTGPAILVYPAGIGESWNAGGCCGEAYLQDVDDVTFVRAMVAEVLDNQPDASRTQVYAAGYSNGGRLVYHLACEAPGLFTAVAAVGAIATGACDQPTPFSVMQVVYSGDPELNPVDVDNQVAASRSVDTCGDDKQHETAGDVSVTVWADCVGGRQVGLAIYNGNSHGWPTGDDFTPSAQRLIWQFLTGIHAPATSPAT